MSEKGEIPPQDLERIRKKVKLFEKKGATAPKEVLQNLADDIAGDAELAAEKRELKRKFDKV